MARPSRLLPALAVLLALAASVAPARADDPWAVLKKQEPTESGEAWAGLWDGKTLRPGEGMIAAEVGFPEAGVGAQFGVARGLDIGGRLTFSFIPSHRVTSSGPGSIGPAFGIGATVPIRIALMRSRAADISIRVEPGGWFPYFTPNTGFGIVARVAVTGGVSVVPGGTVFGFLDAPLFFQFVPVGGYLVATPIFLGVGYEHHIGELFGVGGRVMIGPDIVTSDFGGTSGTSAQLGLGAEAFFVFRWDRLPHREAPPEEETSPWGEKRKPAEPKPDDPAKPKKEEKLW